MIRYKKIFILGAGFSKSIANKMPTLKELPKELLEENEPKYNEIKTFFKELQDKTNSYRKFNSIETLCQLILSKPFYYSCKEEIEYKILRNELLSWLYNKIDGGAPTIDSEKEEAVAKFIEYNSFTSYPVEFDRKSIILSFNYDLLLERLIGKNVTGVQTVDYFIELNRYRKSGKVGGLDSRNLSFDYIKLHGSFNWFLAPAARKIDLTNVFYVSKDDNIKELVHKDDVPIYIPMSLSKTKYIQGTLFNILWRVAITFLEMAEEINFIGYGFPESDIDNTNLFLTFKDKINDIVIYDNNSEDKLTKIFNKSNIIKMDAYSYLRDEMYKR